MRKTLPFAILLAVLSLPAAAGDATITATCSASSCTGTAFASLTASDGAFLGDMRSFRITICVDSGQTLSGGGTLEIGYLSPLQTYNNSGTAVWSQNKSLTLNVTSTARCETFPDQRVWAERGRLYVRANAVTASAGATTLTINIERGTL